MIDNFKVVFDLKKFAAFNIGILISKDIKLKNSMKKKTGKKRAAALGNMQNIREKPNHKYVSKCIFPLSSRD